jgi:O-antigen/teichoic acid export membrane protein
VSVGTRVGSGTSADASGAPRVGRGIAQTLAAQTAPLVIALIAMPLLLHGYGEVRFGVLTLVWALIGYLGLFDLGIGRALTRQLADGTGAEGVEAARRATLIRTALAVVVVIGVAGALVFAMIAPALVALLRIPPGLQVETLGAFRIAAFAVPFATTATALRGVLEADGRFGAAALLRFPLAAAMLLAPLAALQFSSGLAPAVASIVASRVALCMLSCVVVLRNEAVLRGHGSIDAVAGRALLGFGGWVTVNMTLGPLMLTMDRFIVGAVISAAAIAWYATPMEVVSRLWVVPAAVTTVLFPVLARLGAAEPVRAAALMRRAGQCLFLALVPPAMIGIVWAHELLTLWIGSEFADRSYRAAQLLLAGGVLAGLQSIPFVLLQGIGRPDLPAKLNLIELPLYAVLAVALTARFGVAGCAAAWLVRIAVDSALLLWLADRRLGGALLACTARSAALHAGGAGLVLAFALVLPSGAARIALMLIFTLTCGLALLRVIPAAERADLLRGTHSRPAGP